MEELGKFNVKRSVIPNAFEKCMSSTINNNLNFNWSFQFLSSSTDSLVKNLSIDDFKYLSHEFDNNGVDLVKQKGCCPYEYISDFEKFKEKYLPKKIFINRQLLEKYDIALNV